MSLTVKFERPLALAFQNKNVKSQSGCKIIHYLTNSFKHCGGRVPVIGVLCHQVFSDNSANKKWLQHHKSLNVTLNGTKLVDKKVNE